MGSADCQNIRNNLLDAAEQVVACQGVAKLTLDAVARQAGLSKSGLLHHFRSKEALVDAVINRTVLHWKQSLQLALEQQSGPHPTARALLQCSLGEINQWNETLRRSSTAMLSVLVHCPGQDTALHQFYRQIHQQMEREAEGSIMGNLVLAVIDGIWLRWVTGLAPLDDTHILSLREYLKRLLDLPPAASMTTPDTQHESENLESS